MAQRTCDIDGCDRPHYGRGWCKLHWRRWRRHGDPTVTRRPGRATFVRPVRPLIDRFTEKVERHGPDECWPWVGARIAKGYGQMNAGRRGEGCVLVHRVAWEIVNGPIPEGMHVLHRCDTPPCCNPAHLFLGTNADNVADMYSKGRARTRHGPVSAR